MGSKAFSTQTPLRLAAAEMQNAQALGGSDTSARPTQSGTGLAGVSASAPCGKMPLEDAA